MKWPTRLEWAKKIGWDKTCGNLKGDTVVHLGTIRPGETKTIGIAVSEPSDPVFYSVDSLTGKVQGIFNSETGETDPLPEGHVVDMCYRTKEDA